LFIDAANAACGIMAEALLDHWGRGRFKGFSAGSHPAGQLNPVYVSLLQQIGLSAAGLRSKSWTEFHQPDAPVMDFVFVLEEEAVREAWPLWPGNPIMAHWSLPDPQAATGSAAERMLTHRQVFSMIERRVRILASLRLESQGRREAQVSVWEIERAEPAFGDAAAA
jgi:arsenate reductase